MKLKAHKLDASKLNLVTINTNKMAADFRKMHPQIEVVIQIDKEIYKEIAEFNEAALNHSNPLDRLIYRIKNGTFLPEGHGKLVDVGQCNRKLFYQQCGGADSLITVKSAFDMLVSLPTIVAADVESEG